MVWALNSGDERATDRCPPEMCIRNFECRRATLDGGTEQNVVAEGREGGCHKNLGGGFNDVLFYPYLGR